MTRRILAMLCVLALMLGMVNTLAFAADTDTAARIGTQIYTSLQAAVDAYGAGVITLEADAQDVTVEKDTYLDLNGHDIENVTVTGGTLYCMDSRTDDYSVSDGVYGKLTGTVSGNVAGVSVEADCAEDGYLMVAEAEGISFHRVKLQVYAMSLRAGSVGVYYKSHFIGDEVVAGNVQSFGVALSVVGAPTAENMQTQCGYSRFEDFKAGEGSNAESNTGTLLYGIMKPGNTDAGNARNAQLPVYGRPYIKTASGLMFGAVVSRSLQEQVEAVDGVWGSLLASQKAPVVQLYQSYTAAMDSWNIPNIKGAEDPGVEPDDGIITLPISVTAENGVVTEEVTVSAGGITVTVPAGVKLANGTSELTVTVTPKETSDAGLTLEDSQVLIPMDVHVDGISADNTVPLTIHLGKIMPENLNMGNYTIYHVENGMANEMTLVAQNAEFTAHNQYKYTLDGEVTLHMATFSEVAAVANEENVWNGRRDYSWYNKDADSYEIRNADQLAGFGAIVGGMDSRTQDSFSGKTVTLLADINIGDTDSENGIVFYPIGYYNTDGTYEKTGTAITSGFKTFEGTFDGNGNTISNFYQNTWEMKGDHDWYDANLQYYRDGMGLFGKVYSGTVKNLTVENFSSDGEITTTGVIAAYADCGAVFENISIFNCNPRVYNIGNGGIVGCVGWYANDDVEDPVSFKNITVDNSNKISALWGSYDVACGGLVGQYYPTSGQENPIDNIGIYMENCHVSAQMDVYNDVCGNYQYYAYRYAGILIGSVRENVTVDGHVYPKMDGITAADCTVHFGTWNDYYYCELVDNTTASYTHDHQMSRLEQVASVDAENKTITTLKGETVAIPTSGRVNYVVVKGDHATENATCYHFKDGEVWTHDMAGIQEGIDEDGNGEDDLKEDKQHIYLEFNNLVTGYGWGVTSKGVNDMEGVTILDREEGNSVVKFQGLVENGAAYTTGTTVSVGDLFAAAQDVVQIIDANVQVTVSPADPEDEDYSVVATYEPGSKWDEGTLTFTGTGVANITITDYYFCTPTTITVTIEEKQPVEKFEKVFPNTDDYLYRVGNEVDVKLSSLFAAKKDAEIGSVSVQIEAMNGTAATGVYTSNAAWNNGTINFNGTGVVKVTIKDDDAYCLPTELFLEVVNAKNATTTTSATANDVVLLNDCSFSSIEVSGGHTLYGNGFTLTCSSDSVATDRNSGFVSLNNGTLDNVQIKTPNFSYAVLYDSNKKDSGNKSETDANGKTRYYNVKSAVLAEGNSQILNSYISGGRAAVYLLGGELLIDNSTVEGGAAANIHMEAAQGMTLRDTTLIQEPKQATVHDTTKTLMGLSVIAMCDGNGLSTPITLEGTLCQYAWACEDYKQYVPSAGQSLVSMVLKEEAYLHDIIYSDGETRGSLNLGFLFMPSGETGAKDPVVNEMIIDRRIDSAQKPYGTVDVNGSAYVYSYSNAQGTSEDTASKPAYAANTQGVSRPTVSYEDVNESRVFETEYSETKGWTSTLTVDVDAGDYTFTFDKLLAEKFGQNLNYTVQKADGTAVDKTAAIVLNDSSTTEFVLTITDDQIYNENGDKCDASVEHTHTFMLLASKTSIPAPKWSSQNLTGTPYIVVDSKNSDWNCAVPVLDGLQVEYWSKTQNKDVTLSLGDIPFEKTGLQNGTNNSITIQKDDYTLTITTSGFKTNDNGKPVVVTVSGTNKLYFTVSSSSNYVSTNTTSRTVTINYTFQDANNTDELTLTKTFTVNYSDYNNTQYKYSDFCNGTLTEAGCVAAGTLITLADGRQVPVEDLTGTEQLLVWNLETGAYDSAPIVFVDSDAETEYEIVHLYFSDGTDVEVIAEHGFFDTTLGQYVYLDRNNAADYIGHSFVKQGDLAEGTWGTVMLTDVVIENKVTTAYSPVTFSHLCYYVDGMLSMPGGIEGLFNIFEVDADTMAYDAEKKAQDIETYGLFTYEDFADLIPEEAFYAFNGAYLKVAIGKGMLTWEDIEYLAQRYVPLM